jgi:hypothetical protein
LISAFCIAATRALTTLAKPILDHRTRIVVEIRVSLIRHLRAMVNPLTVTTGRGFVSHHKLSLRNIHYIKPHPGRLRITLEYFAKSKHHLIGAQGNDTLFRVAAMLCTRVSSTGD